MDTETKFRRFLPTNLSIFVVVFFVLHLLVPASGTGSAATTAIISSTGTVCAIVTDATPPNSICCFSNGSVFPIFPAFSFSAISSGRDYICGITTATSSILCWSPTTKRKIYRGQALLRDISVGEDHVGAVEGPGRVLWWRDDRRFPTNITGDYRSLTSGNGFSCAVDAANNRRVKCWSRMDSTIGGEIEEQLSNYSMQFIMAGDSHLCGLSSSDLLVCAGRNDSAQLGDYPSASAYHFSSLALGRRHSCGVRRANGTVVCWGHHGDGRSGYYNPVGGLSVTAIVAAGDLTCGIVSSNLSVVCWNVSGPPHLSPPLGRVLPGLCTESGSCQCGSSQSFCPGSGVICKPCEPEILPSPSPPPPQQTPSSSPSLSRGILAFAIVGSIGSFAGVCSITYCIWIGICRQKRVHNSVQPTIALTSGSGRNTSSPRLTPATLFSSFSMSMKSKHSLVFKRQESRTMSRQRSGPSSAKFPEQAEDFAFSELAAATNNFSPETKIGSGSYGTVYKGKLPDGRVVAIKRNEKGPATMKRFQDKETAFQSELAFLSRLHHKHLVGLAGFCEEEEERLLVYDFMENGALYDHLHPRNGNDSALNTWEMRIKVLLDASRGIEYLHNYAVPPIIHRDIKSSNILIDGNWVARVSDFGLSLIGPASGSFRLSMKAAGTVGYIDPEYYGLHHLTVKSDVYSFGVVMLEVLTGRKAIFRWGNEGTPTNVVDYAMPRIVEGNVRGILDPRVMLEPGTDEEEAVELVAFMAVSCVSSEGKERPSISDVVANLDRALNLCASNDSFSGPSVSPTSVD